MDVVGGRGLVVGWAWNHVLRAWVAHACIPSLAWNTESRSEASESSNT